MADHESLTSIPGFRLVKQLSTYGPSQVWKAYSERADRFVILHYLPIRDPLDEKSQRRFLREAGICARLDHSGLVRFLTQGITDDLLWFATELVEGIDLEQLVKKRQPVTVGVASRVMTQVLDIVAYLHRKRIVHRGLRPESIWVKEKPGSFPAYLMDLGSAKCFQTADLEGPVTHLGERGYPVHAFTAPEALENPQHSDPRSDIYALGALFYFLLTSRAPYDALDEELLLMKIVEEDPLPLCGANPGLSKPLVKVVERAMVRDVNARYSTVQEMSDALRQAVEDIVPEVNQVSHTETTVGKGESSVIRILFLAANPSDTTRLRLDKESRAIDETLRQSKFRDLFDVRQHWAVRVSDIQGLLLRYRPDIVHFSGHGRKPSKIVLEDNTGNSHPVSVRALNQLFSVLKDNIRCVVLNACYSEQQATAIAQHIDCVVGMSGSIGDSAAISFATAFYQALGYGRDVKTAFDLGCVQIDLENLDEQDIPKLLAVKSKPEELVFLNSY